MTPMMTIIYSSILLIFVINVVIVVDFAVNFELTKNDNDDADEDDDQEGIDCPYLYHERDCHGYGDPHRGRGLQM